jgi:hypothetical protein
MIPQDIQLNQRFVVHLTIQNRDGSVEHYYHFLLGFLIPLVHWYVNHKGDHYHAVLIRSCAVLDPLIQELNLPNVRILPKQMHKSLDLESEWEGYRLKHVYLEGYDAEAYYDGTVFKEAVAEIKKRLHIVESSSLPSVGTETNLAILVIDRKPPNDYYLSEEAEVGGAGKSRRDIPNIDRIAASLERFGKVEKTSLEGMSFKDQILKFKQANLIVAQHGAALASLIFSPKGTIVVEILPVYLHKLTLSERIYKAVKKCILSQSVPPDYDRFKTLFSGLSTVIGLNYTKVSQKGTHQAVPVEKVVEAVEQALSLQGKRNG